MTLLTSKADEIKERDLMAVKYKRVQNNSPEYLTAFEGIDQSIDVALSTFVLHAEPEPVITIFNFVMTTFVPGNDAAPQPTPAPTPAAEVKPEVSGQIVLPPGQAPAPAPSSEKISVHARLDSFQGIYSTLTCCKANADIFLFLQSSSRTSVFDWQLCHYQLPMSPSLSPDLSFV